MSRGQIIVQGTPNFIKSNFGIGYELKVLGVTEKDSQKISAAVSQLSTSIEIRIAKTGTSSKQAIDFNAADILITLPAKVKGNLLEVVQMLEQFGKPFIVKSNSLQDSFLKIGEKEFRTSGDELKQLESKVIELTRGTVIDQKVRSHFLFLLKRKWLLMVNIPIQFIIFLTVTIFPVFILLFTVDSLGSDDLDLSQSYKELAGAVFLVTMVMLCSIFVYVPCYERGSNMRFLMQRLGISSGKY